MAAIMTSVMNFSVAHRGKVVGILDSCFSGGPALMALLYGVFFVRGHDEDEQNQDLRGFYLTSAIAFIVINLLGVAFLGIYREPDVVSVEKSTGCVQFCTVFIVCGEVCQMMCSVLYDVYCPWKSLQGVFRYV